jgi:hypothetical protein
VPILRIFRLRFAFLVLFLIKTGMPARLPPACAIDYDLRRFLASGGDPLSIRRRDAPMFHGNPEKPDCHLPMWQSKHPISNWWMAMEHCHLPIPYCDLIRSRWMMATADWLMPISNWWIAILHCHLAMENCNLAPGKSQLTAEQNQRTIEE